MNVGDFIYVPHATSWIWEPTLSKIEEITDDYYICEVLVDEWGSREGLTRRKIGFKKEYAFTNKADCEKYISEYYYDGLCRGCKYDDVETNWNCNDCKYKIVVKPEDVTGHDLYVCSKCDIIIGGTYTGRHEICKYYEPTLPQNIREYNSWEAYDDVLRNCEYNRECAHHKNSCHKTCSYDRYMNQFVRIGCKELNFVYNERKVESYLIKRSEWINLDFKDKDGFYCWGLRYESIKNKNGTYKKGTVNNGIMFEKRTKITLDSTKIL